eukprot:c20795_g1_i1 orf=326-1138(+)
MQVLTAGYHCPWATVKNGSVLGLASAFLHVSALRQEKWESKFRPGANRYKSSDTWRKEYMNYVKRKKRTEKKKELHGWTSMHISYSIVDEILQPHYCGPSMKARKKQNVGKNSNWESWTGFHFQEQENTSTRKRHKSRYGCHDDGPSQRHFGSGPFYFDCFFARHQSAQWRKISQFFFEWDTDWEGSSFYEGENTEQKKNEPTIGSASDRQALGLSPTGPLTLEAVKIAFRSSALKWHPDRHKDGAAKAMAEEKFKHCGAAYKALLNALA